MLKNGDNYPAWVCTPCGDRFGRGAPEGHLCTMHIGACGICGATRAVTEPRDFGHLRPGWASMHKYNTGVAKPQ